MSKQRWQHLIMKYSGWRKLNFFNSITKYEHKRGGATRTNFRVGFQVHTFFQVCSAMNHTYLFVTLASLMQFGLLQKCNQHVVWFNISGKLLLEKIDSSSITPCIPGGLIISGQDQFTSLRIVLCIINKLFGPMMSYHGLNSTCFAPNISTLKPSHCHNIKYS